MRNDAQMGAAHAYAIRLDAQRKPYKKKMDNDVSPTRVGSKVPQPDLYIEATQSRAPQQAER